jgi:tetrahydromethanopterin:alpha-L-glutamate ligase
MKRIGVAGLPGAWSTMKLVSAVEARAGSCYLIDMSTVSLDLSTGEARSQGIDLTSLDAIIVKKIAPLYTPDALDRMAILSFVHHRGVPVFSHPDSMLQLIDRLSGTIRLRLGGIPMPRTLVTEDIEQATQAVETFGRAVFKPLYSSKARGMAVIQTGPEMKEEIEDFKAAGNQVMYIQEFVRHAGRDLGVSFLGGEYVATYARQGSGRSWDTTTRTGGKYIACSPDRQIVDLAHRAQNLFADMAFTCVDVVETPDGPLVYEVSAFGGFRGLLEANGIDMAERYAQYVLERIQ